MKSNRVLTTALWSLGALNALLVAMVVNRYLPESKAMAQAARPSDYIMVPGTVTGISTGVIFIVDTSRGELSGMTYDDTTNVISPMPKIDLTQVFKAGAGVGTGGTNKTPKGR